MNKTEFKKKAKTLVKNNFDVFSNVKIIEMDSGYSAIDNNLFIKYVVIINNANIYLCYVSVDKMYDDDSLFFKETRITKTYSIMGLYNSNTLEKIY